MAPRLPERLDPVAGELALGDDVGLADQACAEAADLHLVTERRGRYSQPGGSLGERQQAYASSPIWSFSISMSQPSIDWPPPSSNPVPTRYASRR